MRQKQLIRQAQGGKPTTFITLTSNPATGTTPASRARALARAWPKIVKLAMKKYGYKEIPYLCVFEATKRGEPHLHILCRVKWIDQRWLSNQMRVMIGAPIVDIRQVKSQRQVALYISKYIGKEPHRFATCKRYWSTRSYVLASVELKDGETIWSESWHIIKRGLPELRRLWEAKGYDVAMEGHILIAMAEPPPQSPGAGG